jgi:hypothetical protein
MRRLTTLPLPARFHNVEAVEALCDFWYEAQNKAKQYARDNGIKGWNA